ncbi:MAG: hypothetical protein AAGK78_04300, partial [Planctomycetota bacterium]
MLCRPAAVLLFVLLARTPAPADVSFEVKLPTDADAIETGRLVVFVIDEGGAVGLDRDPADGPYWREPEPIFGTDVVDWQPGDSITLADDLEQQDGFRPNLPAGKYKFYRMEVQDGATLEFSDKVEVYCENRVDID